MTTTLQNLSLAAVGALMLTFGIGKTAEAAVINFDNLHSGEIVDNQYLDLGVDFNGSPSVLTQGDGLDPNFPPVSGNNLVYNYPFDAITVNAVNSAWDNVGGYVTSGFGVTLTAYDANNRVLGMASTSGSNVLNSTTGLSPNIFLKVVASNIAYVKFMAQDGAGGNSFTLDDFTFERDPAYCLLP
jgi:hypothetical protein